MDPGGRGLPSSPQEDPSRAHPSVASQDGLVAITGGWGRLVTPVSGVSCGPTRVGLRRDAILRTLAYGDVFEFPLTVRDVHRYLDVPAAADDVAADLLAMVRDGSVETDGTLHWLAGRDGLADLRHRRALTSATLWPHALRYGRVIGALPFVRMVAVTGALAVDNVGDHADIDYLMVTETGRLWLARGLVIGVVRRAGLRGLELCPNYLLSERAIELDDRDRFTAHELAQMVPLHGLDVYWAMRERNAWVAGHLPNANGLPRAVPTRPVRGTGLRRRAEVGLRGPVGERVERWERARKIRRFSAAEGSQEVCFTADVCKGHFAGYRGRILDQFHDRLRALDVPAESPGQEP